MIFIILMRGTDDKFFQQCDLIHVVYKKYSLAEAIIYNSDCVGTSRKQKEVKLIMQLCKLTRGGNGRNATPFQR